MIDFSTISSLTIDGKAVNRVFIDGENVYSTVPDAKETYNNEAWEILKDSVKLGTDSYKNGSSTYTYNVWSTFEEEGFTASGTGASYPIPVSPHVLISAAHWGSSLPTGTINYGGVSVTLGNWTTLKDWAASKGKSIEYSAILDGDDIALCRCEKTSAIPDACIPWFIDKPAFKYKFWSGTPNGVVCWHSPQKTFTVDGVAKHYAVPMVMRDFGSWGVAKTLGNQTGNANLEAKFTEMGNQYIGYTGDSGKAIYIMMDGKPVIVSADHTTTTGPDYIAAVGLLRQFVKEYEGTDTMKLIV